MELSQGGFNEGGGGTDDGGNPHPEYSSRAAGGNCSHDTHQVAHAHSCSGRDDESLEGGKTVFAVLFLRKSFQHIRKKPDGKKMGPDGEKNSRGNQKQDQKRDAETAAAGERNPDEIAPEKLVDGID